MIRLSKLAVALGLAFTMASSAQAALILTGIVDGPLSGGIPKAVELYATSAIPDLSVYGVESANNGGGSVAPEFTFPAVSASAGQYIYLATEATAFMSFFGFAPDYTDSSATNINGDDAIVLWQSGSPVDIYGDPDMDGTGETWEYLDGWVYRNNNTGPDGSTFVESNWALSGINALDGETTNDTSANPFPIGTYTPEPATLALLALGGVALIRRRR